MERSAIDWQYLVVLAAFAWALAYVIRRIVQAFRAPERGGCGSCGNASSCSTGNAKPFVSIDSLNTQTNAGRD